MNYRRCRSLPVASSALALLLLSGAAFGQEVLTNGGFPFAWNNPYGANNVSPGGAGNPPALINQGNVAPANQTAETLGGVNYGLVRLTGRATATEDGNAVRDRFRWSTRREQDFEVAARGGQTTDLWAPMFFRGAVEFFKNPAAPNVNAAVGKIVARVELLEFVAGVYQPFAAPMFVESTIDRAADVGNMSLDEIKFIHFGAAPAGRYRLQATLTLEGDANPLFGLPGASNNGSGVRVFSGLDPHGSQTTLENLASGLFTSIGYKPTELTDSSRARVGATDAVRNAYGVTGAGVLVGQLEAGRAFTDHDGLDGGKVTQLSYWANKPVGPDAADANKIKADGRNEHATAVAGIIAGDAGNDSQKGVAPGANLVNTSAVVYSDDPPGPGALKSGQKQFNALWDAGARIVNMSAAFTDLPETYVDMTLNNDPRKLFVKSAGNSGIAGGGANTITQPGMSYNSIVVGALDGPMTALASYSSTNEAAGGLRKPDLVAPGSYITAPIAVDTNNDGQINDFDRRFTGAAGRTFDSTKQTGSITGTSFAAPHVAGAGALMMEYRDQKVAAGDFDATSDDFRVLKAVMLNTATRTGIGGWLQKGTNLQSNTGMVVTESLDNRLGAGLLNVEGALRNYAAGEVRLADNNVAPHFNISVPTNPDRTLKKADFWDRESVESVTLPLPGPVQYHTVNYNLGSFSTVDFIAEDNGGYWVGRVAPNFSLLKAALTWARPTNAAGTAYQDLPALELRLYMDGLNIGNTPGFDPANADQDMLLAKTEGAGENVKILDYIASGLNFSQFLGAVLPDQGWAPIFYLQVVNLNSAADVTYGLSVTLPAPGAAAVFGLPGVFAARRRRA